MTKTTIYEKIFQLISLEDIPKFDERSSQDWPNDVVTISIRLQMHRESVWIDDFNPIITTSIELFMKILFFSMNFIYFFLLFHNYYFCIFPFFFLNFIYFPLFLKSFLFSILFLLHYFSLFIFVLAKFYFCLRRRNCFSCKIFYKCSIFVPLPCNFRPNLLLDLCLVRCISIKFSFDKSHYICICNHKLEQGNKDISKQMYFKP